MPIIHWRTAVAIVAILTAGAGAQQVTWQATDASSVNWDPARADEIPKQIGDWVMVEEVPFDEEQLRQLYRLATVGRAYRRGADGPEVLMSLVYGRTMQAMHFPERCVRAQGWNMTSMRSTMVPTGDQGESFEATVVNSERKPDRRAQNLYVLADAHGTSAAWLGLVWGEGRRGLMQNVVCLVIIGRELMPAETEEESLGYLQDFLVDVMPHVHDSLRPLDGPARP